MIAADRRTPQFRALFEIRHELLAEAVARAPEEACGLLSCRRKGFRGQMTLHAAQNAAQEPETSFLIPPLWQMSTMLDIEAAGEELWGIFHSHPDQGALPSERDAAFAADPDLAGLHWVIIGLEPDDGEPEAWVGRL